MRALPQPTPAEITDALRDAVNSADPTIREMLRVIWLITRSVHPRAMTFWDTLPDIDGAGR